MPVSSFGRDTDYLYGLPYALRQSFQANVETVLLLENDELLPNHFHFIIYQLLCRSTVSSDINSVLK